MMRAAISLGTALACLAQVNTPEPMISVPAGTSVQLQLESRLDTRTTKPGDTVRAQIAFPVALGGRVVIPVGSYVEGAVKKIAKKRSGPRFYIEFDRLVFSNGYTVDGSNGRVEALRSPGVYPNLGAMSFQFPIPQPPTLPPLPTQKKPNVGLMVGVPLGAIVGLTVIGMALSHSKRYQYPYVVESGSKIEMTLANDLQLETASLPKP